MKEEDKEIEFEDYYSDILDLIEEKLKKEIEEDNRKKYLDEITA